MKKTTLTKLLGIVLIMALVMSMGITAAFADVTITVDQDSTFKGEDGANSRTFTYKQIFHATKDKDSTTSGGGYDDDGTPGATTVTPATGVGYSYFLNATADSARIAQLGSWVAANPDAEPPVTAHWERVEGNNWFDLTPSADGSQYVVTWANSATDTDTAQAAAEWLNANYTPITSGSLTWDSAKTQWSVSGLEEGYYLISSDTGDNLIAATTNIDIKEKNSYPPLDKTQADEDKTTKDDASRDVAVGDVLNYDVKVTIPKTAKVGDEILVWDKPTTGLTYNNDVTVSSNAGNATVADATPAAGQAWAKLITVTADSIGKDVVFSFSMTVNSSAVTTTKENESGLKYGRDGNYTYESKPDRVEFKTYFAGIEKIDGQDSSIKLENVEFTLKEGTAEFKVSKVTDSEHGDYYIYDANGSSTVKTDANGIIRIRGLDKDKTYTLTETKNPNNGYNMMADPVTLNLTEDTYTVTVTPAATEGGEPTTTTTSSYNGTTANTWQDVVNNKGTVLPSTGGIGTTIFYVVGSILVVAAGVLLITKKRMSREG